MSKKLKVKELPEVYYNPEFNKAADALIERIKEYKRRHGEAIVGSEVVDIATQIVEKRV